MRDKLDLFIKYLKRNKSPRTIESYSINCNKFIEWLESNGYDSLELSQDVYLDYIDDLKTNYKNSSIKTKMISIYNFIEFLYDRELISELPFKSYSAMSDFLPVVSKKEIVTLTSDQLNDMIRATNGDLYKTALIHFMYDTAVRVSEVTNVKWSNIENKDGIYTIAVYGKGKGGYSKVRHVNITKETYEMIKELRKHNMYNEYVFASVKTLKKVTERRVKQIISDTAKKAGIENVTTHIIRKTSATSLLENGMPIEYVSQYLGHESVNTTVNHYVDRDRDMANKFDKYYKSF